MVQGFRLSIHAEVKVQKRNIPSDWVESTLQEPEQIVDEQNGLVAYQSRFTNSEGKTYLVRLIVDEYVDPKTIVTVYMTSKVTKYWRMK